METKQKRAKVVMSMLALAALCVFSLFSMAGSLEPPAAPGPTMKTLDEVEPRIPIHASDLPLTITEPNSYYLVEDVNFTDDANDAITIECDDVTIDLMGYTLKGPDSGTKSGIHIFNRTNIEVRNGTVRDFGSDGIHEGHGASRNHRIINVRTLSNGARGIYIQGSYAMVKGCTASNNGSDGIYAGSFGKVAGNVATQNGGDGIDAIHGLLITDNASSSNDLHGFRVGDGCTVTNNTACYNDEAGIYATSQACTVTGNTIYNNNWSLSTNYGGIRVSGDCLVKGNVLDYNRQNNIYVFGSGNAIEENLVTDSTNNGIYFDSSGNFYANNRASGNVYDYNDPGGNTDGGGNVSF
ncbi:MAG: right-handed parallel beta-helix repeat-containing protein [Planctomycetota bacterium]|jgi:parallel beta-helix repeat protein